MQKEPSARYADMSELIAALRPIAEPTSASPIPSEPPAESLAAVDSPVVASQKPPATEVSPRKHAIPTPPELSATPFVPAAVALAPKNDEPGDILTPTQAVPNLSDADVESRRKQTTARVTTPLPAGAAQVLEKAPPLTAPDYSVFELPAVNDPLPPPEAQGLGPVPTVLKLQPPASRPGSLPVPDDVIMWKSSQSRQQLTDPGHSLEERFGLKGILLLALFAGLLVFVLGYLLFSLLVHP
jgi:hypothetical protein